MEKYTMFLDWKNQYSENEYTTQGNLQIYAIPIKLPMVFLTQLEQIISQFVQKHKKPQIAKATLRKKNGYQGLNLKTKPTSKWAGESRCKQQEETMQEKE